PQHDRRDRGRAALRRRGTLGHGPQGGRPALPLPVRERAHVHGEHGGGGRERLAHRGLRMIFRGKLVEGRLIRRYKRFLADIQLPEGVVTAACPNTGSLMGCCEPGSRVWLSESDSASRKYRHTWEIVEVGKVMVGINTGLPNKLVSEAIVEGVIGEL